MGELLRFSPFLLPSGVPSLQTDEDGDWVAWKDAKECIAALEALVKEYGEHQAFCSASEHPGVNCDCGLDAALGEVDGGK